MEILLIKISLNRKQIPPPFFKSILFPRKKGSILAVTRGWVVDLTLIRPDPDPFFFWRIRIHFLDPYFP